MIEVMHQKGAGGVKGEKGDRTKHDIQERKWEDRKGKSMKDETKEKKLNLKMPFTAQWKQGRNK